MLIPLQFVAAQAQREFLREVAPLPRPRQMHGSAVVGDYLYMIGGAIEGGKVDRSVIYARIDAQGNLDSWQLAMDLPQPRVYIGTSTIALNDTVYIVGGSPGVVDGRKYSTALIGVPDATGNIREWKETAPIPGDAVLSSAAIATQGYLHVLAGLAQNQPTAQVFSARVMPDRSLGPWAPSPPLPSPLWYHHAAVAAGRVYTWGGLTANNNKAVTDRVFSAPILMDGRLGAWREEPQRLGVPIYAASTAVAGPYLMSFSPRLSGSAPTNDIWWTSARLDGLAEWRRQPTTVPNRLYHASAQDYRRGLIYLSGGRSSKEDVASHVPKVYVFALSAEARAAAYASQPDAAGASGTDVQAEMQAAPAATAVAATGFVDYEAARRSGKPIIMYFDSPMATTCQEQMRVLDAALLGELSASHAVTRIDVTRQPQFVQEKGVWRVPAWIVFDQKGAELRRKQGLMSREELKAFAGGG